MARISCRPSALMRMLLPAFAALLVAPAGVSAAVRPLQGHGNFSTSVDVVNRWRSEQQLDVLVLVEVANADLAFLELDGGLQGRMRLEASIESLDGQVISGKRPLRTALLTTAEASSPTLFQSFGLVLEDVPFRSGRITVDVYDVNERKEGLLSEMRKESRVSSSAGAWAAWDEPRAPAGIALEDPLFLAHAPLDDWRPGTTVHEASGWLHDYMHPSRRYGLEQDRLQVFVPVWPPLGGVPLEADSLGLRLTITSLDLDFALSDTIEFDNTGRGALAAGRPAGLFYELDVNLLPEGSFLLSLAPLERRGRGAVTEFDVVWRLAALARRPEQLRGEGRTIFHGQELDRFLASSAAEQEAQLTAFWDGVNPDRESPINEAYLEFQYRLAFVREFLGGFDETGAQRRAGRGLPGPGHARRGQDPAHAPELPRPGRRPHQRLRAVRARPRGHHGPGQFRLGGRRALFRRRRHSPALVPPGGEPAQDHPAAGHAPVRLGALGIRQRGQAVLAEPVQRYDDGAALPVRGPQRDRGLFPGIVQRHLRRGLTAPAVALACGGRFRNGEPARNCLTWHPCLH